MRKTLILALPLLAAVGLLAAACGRDGDYVTPAKAATKAATCPQAWRAGWQALANRIGAPVYCPSWIPSPLDAKLRGGWNTVNSVSNDGSYLVGFAWQERGEEVHVNFRGYPGKTAIPTCIDTTVGSGKVHRRNVPCFSDPRGAKRLGAIEARVFTVNRDADQWHVLYAWRAGGSLYTVSEHIAPPLTYSRVVKNLDRMTRGLVLTKPST